MREALYGKYFLHMRSEYQGLSSVGMGLRMRLSERRRSMAEVLSEELELQLLPQKLQASAMQ